MTRKTQTPIQQTTSQSEGTGSQDGAHTVGAADESTSTAQTTTGGTPKTEEGAQPSESVLGGPSDQQGQASRQANEAALEVTLPEGVQVDETMLAGFKTTFGEVARDLGLEGKKASGAASKMVAWYAEHTAQANQAAIDAHKKQGEIWAQECRAHPDFGGQKFEHNVKLARSAIAQFGPELREVLSQYGLDNHPAIFAFAARIGAAIAEDTTSAPKAPSKGAQPDSRLDRYKARHQRSLGQAGG